MTVSRRWWWAAALALLGIALGVMVTRDTGGRVSVGGTSSHAGRAGAGADSAGSAGGAAAAADASSGRQVANATKARAVDSAATMPLAVSVSDTSKLRDGDVVRFHVKPEKGSNIFGFEAFLCRSGASYLADADIRPSWTGNCVTKPLSANSQDYADYRVAPPYTSADGIFRVGTGTDTYQRRDGRTSTITCGSGHPCTLVLKLQYPDGYGFKAIPLTFR